jgi:hypothetical protein
MLKFFDEILRQAGVCHNDRGLVRACFYISVTMRYMWDAFDFSMAV